MDEEDHLSILSGIVKYRDDKKWKSRFATLRRLSPVADTLHLQLFKDAGKGLQIRGSLSLDNFRALETGFTLDRESNTLALLCDGSAIILAFNAREALIQWQVRIAANVPYVVQFGVHLLSSPSSCSTSSSTLGRRGGQCDQARLHVQDGRLSLVAGAVPSLSVSWPIADLRRYGVLEGRYVVEAGARCGTAGSGVFVFAVSAASLHKLAAAVDDAAVGKLHSCRQKLQSTAASVPIRATDGSSVTRARLRRSCSRDSSLTDSSLTRQSGAQWSAWSGEESPCLMTAPGPVPAVSLTAACATVTVGVNTRAHSDCSHSVVTNNSGGSGSSSGAIYNTGSDCLTAAAGGGGVRDGLSPLSRRRHRCLPQQQQLHQQLQQQSAEPRKTSLHSLRQTGVLDTDDAAGGWGDHLYEEPRDKSTPLQSHPLAPGQSQVSRDTQPPATAAAVSTVSSQTSRRAVDTPCRTETVVALVHCSDSSDSCHPPPPPPASYDTPRSHIVQCRHVYEEPGSKKHVPAAPSNASWYQTPRPHTNTTCCSSSCCTGCDGGTAAVTREASGGISGHYQLPGPCCCDACQQSAPRTQPPPEQGALAAPSDSQLYSQLQLPVYAAVDKNRSRRAGDRLADQCRVTVVDDLVPVSVLTRSVAALTCSSSSCTDNSSADSSTGSRGGGGAVSSPLYVNISAATAATADASCLTSPTATAHTDHHYQQIGRPAEALSSCQHSCCCRCCRHGQSDSESCSHRPGHSVNSAIPLHTSDGNCAAAAGRVCGATGGGPRSLAPSGAACRADTEAGCSSLSRRHASRTASRRPCCHRAPLEGAVAPLRSMSLGRSSASSSQLPAAGCARSSRPADPCRPPTAGRHPTGDRCDLKLVCRSSIDSTDSGVFSLSSGDLSCSRSHRSPEGDSSSSNASSCDGCPSMAPPHCGGTAGGGAHSPRAPTGLTRSDCGQGSARSDSGQGSARSGLRPVDKPRSGANYEHIDRAKLLAHIKS